jgi:tetratricopeptide (TPR) repeat protein
MPMAHSNSLLVLFVVIRCSLATSMAEPDAALKDCRSVIPAQVREARMETAIRALSECVAAARQQSIEGKELAAALNDLGTLYHDGDRLTEAARAYAEAIRLWKREGDSRLGLLAPLRNLAAVRLAQARYAEAERLYREAEEIVASLFTPESPEMADVWTGLSETYFAVGRLERARELAERALGVAEPNRQVLAGVSLFILAKIAWQRKDKTMAQFYMRRAVAAWEGSLGPRHQTYASAVASLAVMISPAHPQEAERLFQLALRVLETSVGPRHTYFASVLLDYGRHLKSNGRKREGEDLKRRAELILAAAGAGRQSRTVDVMALDTRGKRLLPGRNDPRGSLPKPASQK